MRGPLPLAPAPALALALALAGCVASAEDPFAYTRKPLYAGAFDLATLPGTTQTQEFRVTDGSIGAVVAQVWINATKGGATVEIVDPSGDPALRTTSSTSAAMGLDLGAWKVRVTPQERSLGSVQILVTRG